VSDAGASIRVNGEPRPLDVHDVAELLERLGFARREGIAVAVNGDVIARRAWPDRTLRSGDEVEIVGAVQGG
jgi:sulfur carrier protein